MAKEFFKDLPNTTTPLTASRLNGLLDGEEAMGNLVVDSIRSKNIVPNAWTEDYRIASDGAPYYETGNSLSRYIEVEPNTTYVRNYTFDAVKPVALYDSSKTFIQRITSGSTFTTTSATKYIRTAIPTAQRNNVQIEKGSTATTFSPYQELNNMEQYATGEIKIGTWTNGKPIYRKLYANLTTPSSNNSWSNLIQDNVNADNIIRLGGCIVDGVFYNDINFGEGSYYVHTQIQKDTNSNYIIIRMIQNGWANKYCFIFIEYTKASD